MLFRSHPSSLHSQPSADIARRYGPAANDTALPIATDDPGAGELDLGDLDTAQLMPAVVDRPPARTRLYPVTISLQNTNDGHFLAFMNSTVRTRCSPTYVP